MVEKIKGISIKGRCFSNDTSLVLYPNNKDRIAVVYGKNGSGKSTISTGFQNVASTTIESDITLKLIDGSITEAEKDECSRKRKAISKELKALRHDINLAKGIFPMIENLKEKLRIEMEQEQEMFPRETGAKIQSKTKRNEEKQR